MTVSDLEGMGRAHLILEIARLHARVAILEAALRKIASNQVKGCGRMVIIAKDATEHRTKIESDDDP